MSGFPKEDRDLKSFKATRQLLVSWDGRHLLRNALIYHPGHLYPYVPSSQARCTRVATQPFGRQAGLPGWPDLCSYEFAIVTAQYTTPTFESPQPYPEGISQALHNNPQAVISETIEPNLEALRLPYEDFLWASDEAALKEDEAPVRPIFRLSYTLTRHNLFSVPIEAKTFVGMINKSMVTPVLMPALEFEPHTLMFVPPTINLSADDEGNTQFDVTYRFAYKEEGWRKFWRGDTLDYDSLVLAKNPAIPYDAPFEREFSVLFPEA